MSFLFQIFLSWQLLLGKKRLKLRKFKEKCKQQKICQNIKITNLKQKSSLLMNKN